jgi:hypothetical protein
MTRVLQVFAFRPRGVLPAPGPSAYFAPPAKER